MEALKCLSIETLKISRIAFNHDELKFFNMELGKRTVALKRCINKSLKILSSEMDPVD